MSLAPPGKPHARPENQPEAHSGAPPASALSLSRAMLESVLDQLPIGAIILDSDAVVQRFNRYEEQLSGRRREEVIGRSFFSDIAPCTKQIELGERFREGIAHGTLDIDIEFSFPYPYNRVARDVRIRAASVSAQPRALHVLLIEDITARKKLEGNNQQILAGLRSMLERNDARATPTRSAQPATPRSTPAVLLFADLSSFVNAARDIPPAELFAQLDARVKVAADAVLRYGGTLEKMQGDGVLAYFTGDPAGGGQAEYAALRAARDLIREDERRKSRLPFRVGVARGEVVIGPMGRPEFGLTSIVGAPVMIAQRLAQTARPREILINELVLERVDHAVETTELGGPVVPGVAGGNNAFRLDHLELP